MASTAARSALSLRIACPATMSLSSLRIARPAIMQLSSLSGGMKRQFDTVFERLDTNRDGVLTQAELVAGHRKLDLSPMEASSLFLRLDQDCDGVISRTEFAELEESTLSSVAAFIANNNPLRQASRAASVGPLGRWSPSVDKFEKSYTYDHSA